MTDTTLELLERAREISDHYQYQDILYDEDGRPYIMVDYDDTPEGSAGFKKRYLDWN